MRPWPPPRVRRLLRGFALSLGILAVSLGVLELSLKRAGYGARLAMFYDPNIGYRFIPNQVRTRGVAGNLEMPPFTIDSTGFRVPSFEGQPNPDVERIACVGDSFTFGLAVHDDESYPAVLRATLGAGDTDRIQVMNFGVPGFNTYHTLRTYETLARPYEPDLVLIGFFLNDVGPGDLAPRAAMGFFLEHLGKTATFEFVQRKLKLPFKWLHELRTDEERQVWQTYKQHSSKIEHAPNDPISQPFWAKSMTELGLLIDAVHADGATAIVLSFPTHRQWRELSSEPERESVILAPQARIAETARAHGAHFEDLTPVFLGVTDNPWLEHDPSHPSAASYRAVAAHVATGLRAWAAGDPAAPGISGD